jgi:hypothetical protein
MAPGWSTIALDTFTIRPQPRSIIAGRSAKVRRIGASTLTAKADDQRGKGGRDGWPGWLDHGRVVHQEVDRTKLLAGRRCGLGDGVGVGEIRRDHKRDSSFAPQRRGRLFELINRAGDQRHTGAPFGQLEGNGASDTPAGPGDQGYPPVKRCDHREAASPRAARISLGSERVV